MVQVWAFRLHILDYYPPYWNRSLNVYCYSGK